ncbi:hypothetical protein [Bosea sp. (in: a-proteobacteria)]|uniref:hypothetical protein n=1 Tax=Bosea sp. (in: a-proteobacteria) TaxID=1871050 RepID=UPI00260561C2|nr:hypothetical protein [Bosea sp. (in: a-proteobacteria)]MCO5089388.1 hypothetical protein [Bosea sp. (in: a-proteobacteria)]
MANSLPWSVKGVDPRTRDAAKAAARRAGMTLGEWLDQRIREESGEAPAEPAPEQHDIAALSERLSRLSLSRTDTAPRRGSPAPSRQTMDSLVDQAAALESMTREANARTAGALESITRWIEKTESRLSSSERGSAERQERATSVIAEAIKTMGERIAEIERRSLEARHSRPEPAPRASFSREGLAAAVTDIRTRQRALDHDEPAAPHPAAVAPERISALREDLRDIGSRLSSEGRRPAAPQRPAAPVRIDTSAIEAKIGMLAERLETLDRRDQFEPLLRPLTRIEAEVSRLAQERPGESYQRFQLEIAHLAAKVDALAVRGAPATNFDPVLRDIADLRDLVASGGQEHKLDDLARQVSTLGFEVGRLRDVQPDMSELRSLSNAIDDVRSAVLAQRGQVPGAGLLTSLSGQVEALSRKFDEISSHKLDEASFQRQSDYLTSRIDSLQQRLETLSEQGPSAVMRQIEGLSGRIESLAAASQLARVVGEGATAVDLNPIEQMLSRLAEKIDTVAAPGVSAGSFDALEQQISGIASRLDAVAATRPAETGIEQMLARLADKIDEAGAPGANADVFDALEQQISGIASRLDEAAATRSAENGIERTLQDLVVHLRSMREETAADRAALVQAATKAAPGQHLAELSSLVSGLRDTHVSSDRETRDALGAVHGSLEAIMSRLANLETELQNDRRTPGRLAAAMRAEDMPVRAEPAPPPPVSAAPQERLAAPAVAAVRAEPVLPASSAFDIPLEPGSGRPRPEPAASAAQDPQSVRQSLIAAARRSARAASEAAAAAPAAGAEPAAKGPGRFKEILEKRKRPLLLGLAALILAMGTAHLVTNSLRGDDARTAGSEARSVIAPPEAPAEPAQLPAKDQASALPAQPQESIAQAAQNEAQPEQPATQAAAAPAATVAESAPVAAPAPAEQVQPVTGIGELPAGFGSAGLRKAALDGDARAVYELASKAADGPAAQRDAKLALRLFERAAAAGLAPAQFRVGNMFEKGIGTQRDLALARIWYQRAAERGNAKAMHNLAVLHAEGASGKPDYATATEWFRRAAEHGVRDSQYNLAVLLGRGLGAPIDLSQSFVWFSVAAGQGDEDAARKRDEVAQRLKPEELAAAKTMAASWKPKTLDAAANEVTPPAKGWDAAPTAAAAKPAKASRI